LVVSQRALIPRNVLNRTAVRETRRSRRIATRSEVTLGAPLMPEKKMGRHEHSAMRIRCWKYRVSLHVRRRERFLPRGGVQGIAD